MERNGQDVKKSRRVSDDLAPYRKLVTLQKQMIELQQQYEKTKLECDALRGGRVKKEPVVVVLPPPPVKADLRQSARTALKGLRGKAAKKIKPILVIGVSIADATQKFVKAVGK